ncbi:hypothetical protein Scep_016991 [Stephania cephalantha]|uniref:Uncharacterized protein n=1 Tax=Stephania cephalantha TaxID=152367 RepID=A0AAP0NTU4_9MAGN
MPMEISEGEIHSSDTGHRQTPKGSLSLNAKIASDDDASMGGDSAQAEEDDNASLPSSPRTDDGNSSQSSDGEPGVDELADMEFENEDELDRDLQSHIPVSPKPPQQTPLPPSQSAPTNQIRKQLEECGIFIREECQSTPTTTSSKKGSIDHELRKLQSEVD